VSAPLPGAILTGASLFHIISDDDPSKWWMAGLIFGLLFLVPESNR
jgi:hypothetical protein